MLYVLLVSVMMESPAHLYATRFCRSDAGDIDKADKFFKEAADMRDACKPLLAAVVGKTLGNANMSDEVLDNLLQRSEVFKEILAMKKQYSMENNDRAGQMSACCSLLTNLGDAR